MSSSKLKHRNEETCGCDCHHRNENSYCEAVEDIGYQNKFPMENIKRIYSQKEGKRFEASNISLTSTNSFENTMSSYGNKLRYQPRSSKELMYKRDCEEDEMEYEDQEGCNMRDSHSYQMKSDQNAYNDQDSPADQNEYDQYAPSNQYKELYENQRSDYEELLSHFKELQWENENLTHKLNKALKEKNAAIAMSNSLKRVLDDYANKTNIPEANEALKSLFIDEKDNLRDINNAYEGIIDSAFDFLRYLSYKEGIEMKPIGYYINNENDFIDLLDNIHESMMSKGNANANADELNDNNRLDQMRQIKSVDIRLPMNNYGQRDYYDEEEEEFNQKQSEGNEGNEDNYQTGKFPSSRSKRIANRSQGGNYSSNNNSKQTFGINSDQERDINRDMSDSFINNSIYYNDEQQFKNYDRPRNSSERNTHDNYTPSSERNTDDNYKPSSNNEADNYIQRRNNDDNAHNNYIQKSNNQEQAQIYNRRERNDEDNNNNHIDQQKGNYDVQAQNFERLRINNEEDSLGDSKRKSNQLNYSQDDNDKEISHNEDYFQDNYIKRSNSNDYSQGYDRRRSSNEDYLQDNRRTLGNHLDQSQDRRGSNSLDHPLDGHRERADNENFTHDNHHKEQIDNHEDRSHGNHDRRSQNKDHSLEYNRRGSNDEDCLHDNNTKRSNERDNSQDYHRSKSNKEEEQPLNKQREKSNALGQPQHYNRRETSDDNYSEEYNREISNQEEEGQQKYKKEQSTLEDNELLSDDKLKGNEASSIKTQQLKQGKTKEDLVNNTKQEPYNTIESFSIIGTSTLPKPISVRDSNNITASTVNYETPLLNNKKLKEKTIMSASNTESPPSKTNVKGTKFINIESFYKSNNNNAMSNSAKGIKNKIQPNFSSITEDDNSNNYIIENANTNNNNSNNLKSQKAKAPNEEMKTFDLKNFRSRFNLAKSNPDADAETDPKIKSKAKVKAKAIDKINNGNTRLKVEDTPIIESNIKRIDSFKPFKQKSQSSMDVRMDDRPKESTSNSVTMSDEAKTFFNAQRIQSSLRKDICIACSVDCNISSNGYSPMTYIPYGGKILRKDITPVVLPL